MDELVVVSVDSHAQLPPEVWPRDGVYQAGNWRGLYDLDIRLAEMDESAQSLACRSPGSYVLPRTRRRGHGRSNS
jgi:hypothetical protein